MSNIRHILRLHTQNQTQSEIIVQTGISRKTLKKHLKDFKDSGLTFAEISELTDGDLEELFLKPEEYVSEHLKALYDHFPTVDKEYKRKGVSLKLMFEEYKIKYPDGVGKTQFSWHFSQWKSRVAPTMRREHKAGDKLYIDFAGEKLKIIDKTKNLTIDVEVFVAILGASQLTYVQAVMSQQKEDFISACEDALHYFGGVPAAIVPDNLKSAVAKSSKYEPTINETFADFAEHYNTTILPARAYKPKDKALVENVIKIIYTRIYAKIRHLVFYTLEDLNEAIQVALEEHNNMIVTGRNYTRRQQFEEIEKATLLPLPALRYEFKKQLYVTVMKNGHVSLSFDKHYYSVPYQFIGKRVKIMFTRYNVEIFHNYERIALHKRLRIQYDYTTDKEHLPPNHRFVNELTADRLLLWAEEIHKDVRLYILKILNQNQHPDQASKVCLGVLNFAKRVGNERLTKACQRALGYGLYNYKTIHKILEKGLDKDEEGQDEQLKMPEHGNIRGKEYYK
ncbi:MAG: IS21 family transposase [Bacteroidota bacterium]